MEFSRARSVAKIFFRPRLVTFNRFRAFSASVAIWVIVVFMAASSWGHPVGEPELEKLAIWRHCCNEHDCIAQPVSILRKEENNLIVDIAGAQTAVDQNKFSEVPSSRTWVCYVVPNGNLSNDNIRCILRPKSGGVT